MTRLFGSENLLSVLIHTRSEPPRQLFILFKGMYHSLYVVV